MSADVVANGTPVGVAETHEFNSSFLNHVSGQIIAGVFAWAAILVTCHQVWPYGSLLSILSEAF
jgi:hypothetical protein